MNDNDNETCLGCQHAYYDHGGWMDEAQRARVLKRRPIGCRIVFCRCDAFKADVMYLRPEGWELE